MGLATHIIGLKFIDNSQPIKEADLLSFKFLIENTGANICEWNAQLIKIYSTNEISLLLINLLNDCCNGKWGQNIKEVAKQFVMIGPFELKEPREI